MSTKRSRIVTNTLITYRQSEKGFAHVLVQGIDFRLQDIDYKFGLIRQKFVREVKYAPNLLYAYLQLQKYIYHSCNNTNFPRLVRRYASEPNDSSYVVSEMIPAYRTAAAQSGVYMDHNHFHSI